MLTEARKRLAAWLDPATGSATRPTTPEPAVTPTIEAWPEVAQQFALRVLGTTYQASSHLGDAEDAEQDPERLGRLYRIDHAITRIRRQAENLQVLAGVRIEDAGSQVTTLLDVVRAGASAVERYQQVRIARVADLAIVEFAADDIMRILTELLDNATKFSPPSTTVTVSAHLTDWGQILVRVEDAGVGFDAGQLPAVNALFSDGAPIHAGVPGTQLGLAVVQRLAASHRLRIQLAPRQTGGTTATVLIPGELLCEAPFDPDDASPQPWPRLRSVPSPRSALGSANGTHTRSDAGATSADDSRPDLPRRTPGSTRGAHAAAMPELPQTPFEPTWPDETGDFAAGIEDAQRAMQATYIEGSIQ